MSFIIAAALAASIAIPTEQDYDLCARTLWGEARGQHAKEQYAVAHIIYNRVKKRHRKAKTVSDVILSRAQFSAWNKNDPNYARMSSPALEHNWRYKRFAITCAIVLNGRMLGDPDPTGGALFYTHGDIVPYWSKSEKVRTAKYHKMTLYYGVK